MCWRASLGTGPASEIRYGRTVCAGIMGGMKRLFCLIALLGASSAGAEPSRTRPTLERQMHLFGTIRGEPVDPAKGVYRAQLIIEKPSAEVAREKLVTPGLPAGNYLMHFGQHVFSPQIFDSLEYLIKNDLREKGEIQLTAAQEHLRQQSPGNYYAAIAHGRRYDTGIPYGLMETQLALALNGTHRGDICEAIARILATQVRRQQL